MRRRRRWFLKGEILVLVCLLAIWTIKSEIIPLDTIEAEVNQQPVKLDRNNLNGCRFPVWHCAGITEQPKKAVEAYEGIVRLTPTDAEAWVELGEAYWACGQHQNALDAYNRAATIKPDWAWPNVVLAFSYRDLQRHDEALEAHNRVMNRVTTLHPDISGLYVIHGELQEEAGYPSEGLAAYKHAVTLKPDNAPAHLHLAKAYLQRGDRELAMKEYEVLKTLDQDLANELLPLVGIEAGHEDIQTRSGSLDAPRTALNQAALPDRGSIPDHGVGWLSAWGWGEDSKATTGSNRHKFQIPPRFERK